MNLFDISNKKLDIKNENLELKDFSEQDKYTRAKNVIDGTGKAFGALGCATCNEVVDTVKSGVDIINNVHYREFKSAKQMDQIEWFKDYRNLTDADIEMFEKRLQEEENEKRLKEQQMDKNITSPTSSLTKPVYLVFHGQTNEI